MNETSGVRWFKSADNTIRMMNRESDWIDEMLQAGWVECNADGTPLAAPAADSICGEWPGPQISEATLRKADTQSKAVVAEIAAEVSAEPNPLQLEVGKTYRRRDGFHARVMWPSCGGKKFYVETIKERAHYFPCGIIGGTGKYESPNDLLKEVEAGDSIQFAEVPTTEEPVVTEKHRACRREFWRSLPPHGFAWGTEDFDALLAKHFPDSPDRDAKPAGERRAEIDADGQSPYCRMWEDPQCYFANRAALAPANSDPGEIEKLLEEFQVAAEEACLRPIGDSNGVPKLVRRLNARQRLVEEYDQLREQLTEYRTALEPFAKDAKKISDDWSDERNRGSLAGIEFTVGDIRRAAAALEATKEGK